MTHSTMKSRSEKSNDDAVALIERHVRNQCALCGAMERGFAYSEGRTEHSKRWWACSMDHQNHIKGLMQMTPETLNEHERQAMDAGGEAGGRYLEELGCFDLSDLDRDQWETFLVRIFSGFRDSMKATCVRDDYTTDPTTGGGS